MRYKISQKIIILYNHRVVENICIFINTWQIHLLSYSIIMILNHYMFILEEVPQVFIFYHFENQSKMCVDIIYENNIINTKSHNIIMHNPWIIGEKKWNDSGKYVSTNVKILTEIYSKMSKRSDFWEYSHFNLFSLSFYL